MAQGVGGDGLGDSRAFRRDLHSALQRLIESMMATANPGARVDRKMALRKHPLPGPRLSGAGMLAVVGKGQLDARNVISPVAFEDDTNTRQLPAHRLDKC